MCQICGSNTNDVILLASYDGYWWCADCIASRFLELDEMLEQEV